MLLDDVASPDLIGADTAVVAALRGRVAADRPAVRTAVLEERVLLFEAEPRILILVLLVCSDGGGTRVRRVRLHVRREHLAQHEDVVPAADRIGADEDRVQHAVGEVPRRLLGARSVEAPDRRFVARRHDLGLGAQLGRRLLTVDPDVFRPIRHRFLRCCLVCFGDTGARHQSNPDKYARRSLPAGNRCVNAVLQAN